MSRLGRGIAAAGALLAALAAATAAAEPLFASPPHVVDGAAGRALVFFLNEPVAGVLATQASAGTIEVIVPQSRVDPAIEGRDFGEPGGGPLAVEHLAVVGATNGDALIHIETAGVPHGVEVRALDDPPRLIVDLHAAAPTPTRPRGRPAASPPPADAEPPAPRGAPAVVPPASAPPAKGGLARRAAASPVPRRAGATATVLRLAAVEDAGAGPGEAAVAEAAAEPEALAPGGAAPPAEAPAAVPAPAAEAAAVAGEAAMPCRLTRVAGVPFCAPDPAAAAYAADPELAAAAAALARPGEPQPALATDPTAPATLYLAADRAFVARAPRGRLLPVVDAYRHALRASPDFADAPRARLNVALAYRTMGFEAELRSAAAAAAGDPGAALARALAGELAVERGALDRARADFDAIADAGGLGPCLAARGRAALALEAGAVASGARELAAAAERCPREIWEDPETAWLQARAQLAAGDAAAALARLEGLRDAAGPAARPRVMADIGAAAEALGDAAAARRTYEALASGRHGPRAAAAAAARLALLDGAAGDVAGALARLDRLPAGEGAAARRTLVAGAARAALAEAAPSEAIALLYEAGVAPSELGIEERVLLARAYRGLGLTAEAEAVLAGARAAVAGPAPEALREEAGALALERGDAGAALALADEWLAAGGGPGALALRARALAAAGERDEALAALDRALAAATPEAARELRLEAARLLRPRDPAAAAALLEAALAPSSLPALPAARAAAARRLLGEAAEAAGDGATALAAFRALAERHADDASAADAAYRAARVAERLAGGGAEAWAAAARGRDPLARRLAGAARDYEAIVAPFAAGAGATP